MNRRIEAWLEAVRDPTAYVDLVVAFPLAILMVLGLTLPIYAIGGAVHPLLADLAVRVAMIEVLPAWVLVYRGLRRRGTA